MDNLEEDTQETITTVTANTSTVTAADLDLTAVAGPITGGGQEENFDDSVIMLPPPHVDVVDLTVSPSQPSTSAGAGACGLLKPKIEEPSGSKDTSTAADNPSTSSSSSVSGLTGASSGVGGGGAHTSSITTTTSNLLECPICLQTCIHPARLPCGHIFCFLCVKGVAYKNRRCAMCRREIPPEFLDHPQLVNGIEDICTTKATDDGYQWFYEGRNGGWWAYDKRSAFEIEEAFQLLQQQNLQSAQITKKENPRQEEVKPENVKAKKDEKKKAVVGVASNSDQDDDVDDLSDGFDVDDEYDDEDEDYDDDDDDDGLDLYDMYFQSPTIDVNTFTYNIQICGSMYTLDFKNMIQYPQNMPYRKRRICRAKGLPSKGVAGILNHSRRRSRRLHRPY